MHVLITAPIDGSFCAAQPGEFVRGHTVTCSGGRNRAYLVGAASHRAADRAVVVDLPFTPGQVEEAIVASMRRAFPGPVTEEDRLEARQLIGLAAELPVGGVVQVTTREFRGTMPTPASLQAASDHQLVARAFLAALCPMV